MLIRKEPRTPTSRPSSPLSPPHPSRAHFHTANFSTREKYCSRIERIHNSTRGRRRSTAVFASDGTDRPPDDDFMPAFTRWKREHFESGFLELRGEEEEVSGIALSTGRVTHRPQRTSTDFNFYSTTLPRQLCSYVASLFFPPSPPISLIPLGLIRLTQGARREGGGALSRACVSVNNPGFSMRLHPHVYINIHTYIYMYLFSL